MEDFPFSFTGSLTIFIRNLHFQDAEILGEFRDVLNATVELRVNEKTSGGFKFNELFRPKSIFKCFAFVLTVVA